MQIRLLFTALSLMSLSLFTFVSVSSAAIFGVDDRVDIKINSPLYSLSRSTAVAVLSGILEINGDKANIAADRLDGLLCKEERFSTQPTLSYSCSGFLVAPDIIATAGHCMVNFGESKNESELYCKAYSWMFDYAYQANGTVQTNNIPLDKIYHCKEIIYAVKDTKAPFRDFALVRLNRAVKDRSPLKLAATDNVSGLLSMIGHPMGTPAKYSRNGKILLNNSRRQSFITTLDANEGNSGSAVFNSKNEVVGILVGGTPSLSTVPVKGKTCEIFNRCDDAAKNCLVPDEDSSVFPEFQTVGSEVQRLAPIRKILKSLGY